MRFTSDEQRKAVMASMRRSFDVSRARNLRQAKAKGGARGAALGLAGSVGLNLTALGSAIGLGFALRRFTKVSPIRIVKAAQRMDPTLASHQRTVSTLTGRWLNVRRQALKFKARAESSPRAYIKEGAVEFPRSRVGVSSGVISHELGHVSGAPLLGRGRGLAEEARAWIRGSRILKEAGATRSQRAVVAATQAVPYFISHATGGAKPLGYAVGGYVAGRSWGSSQYRKKHGR